MARKCVFCRANATTAEHVWPDWLRRREAIVEARAHVQVMQRGTEAPERREWKDSPFKMRVKAVCADCNNGWMSDLEQGAQELLVGMLAGRGRALHRAGQQALSAWALKSAMMFDQASGTDARVIPVAHYKALFEAGVPPAGIRVWMAAYDATQLGVTHVVAAEVTALGQDDPQERNVYVRTFTLGTVAFQVFGTTNPVLVDLEYEWPEPNIHLIWPYRQSITWMPQPAMTDRELMGFGERLITGLAARSLRVEP